MRDPNDQAGFAMVEALVAIAIAAIAGAGLIAALESVSWRSSEVHARDLALREARDLMTEAMEVSSESNLPAKGQNDQLRLSWKRSIEPPGPDFPGMERINIQVRWSTSHKSGVTMLNALRVARHE